jgi:predicted O-methyltransferase YrrM
MTGLIQFVLRYLYALVCSLYLFSFGIFRSKHRELISVICKHFGYTQLPLLLPATKLSKLVYDGEPVRLLELSSVNGNVSALEIIVLSRLVQTLKPTALLEIGTFDGRTTLNLAANCSSNSQVYTLDLPRQLLSSTTLPLARGDAVYIEKEASGSRFRGTDYESRIVQLLGDSASFDFSKLGTPMDFIFIDGSHAYEYVMRDSEQARGLLRDGRGLIVWHDYTEWAGVNRALNELFLNRPEFKDLRYFEQTSLAYLPVNVNLHK